MFSAVVYSADSLHKIKLSLASCHFENILSIMLQEFLLKLKKDFVLRVYSESVKSV